MFTSDAGNLVEADSNRALDVLAVDLVGLERLFLDGFE